MPVVWSCNAWDQLEGVGVGNPLPARFPTPDSVPNDMENGPVPKRIIEEQGTLERCFV